MTDKSPIRGVYERPKGSDVWYICYFDAEHRRHRQKIGSRSLAIKVYQQRKTEIWEGRFEPKATAKDATFRQLGEERMAERKPRLAQTSYRTDEGRLSILLEELGSVPVRSLTAQRVEAALAKISERGCTGATLNRYRTLLSSIFKVGVRNGRLRENPLRQVGKRREPPARDRVLSPDEEPRLRKQVRAIAKHHEWELDLALHTGMRLSEQFDLKWTDVDLERRLITVCGKTGKRSIPINAVAEKALSNLHKLSNGSAWVCPDRSTAAMDWRTWFRDATRAAGIDGIWYHDLRRTFGSRLNLNGVDVRTIQVLLGHRNIETTIRYIHMPPAHVHSAVEKLEPPRRRSASESATAKSKILQMSMFQPWRGGRAV